MVIEVTIMGVMMVVAWFFPLHVKSLRSSCSNTGGGDGDQYETFDCIVCLCKVSPGDYHEKLPNCNHGVHFHARCIDSWLKDHSTCPLCRNRSRQTVYQRLHGCLSPTGQLLQLASKVGDGNIIEVTIMGVMMVVAWFFRLHVKSLRSSCSDTGGGDGDQYETFDCIVCLCEVSPGDDHKILPNCNHGVQFHARCIDSWLKNHSTCPMCRSHVPQTVRQRLHGCLSAFCHDLAAYFDSALENVAASIGDCREF